jgi:SAM-dependent methyltransferase
MTDQLPKGFVINESEMEIEWLRWIGPLLNEGTNEPFSERGGDITGFSRILDLACGPGEWVLEVATNYPSVDVTGIDVSQRCLSEAASHAAARRLNNAHFLHMDATAPLDFPDASFDLVNARTIVGFMNPTLWPLLLKECRRILRPGGILRLTEFSEGLTNSAAAGVMWGMYAKALSVSRRSYDPDGRHIGIVNQLPFLLRQAGFLHVDMEAHPIEHSAGTPRHEGWYRNYALVYQLLKPFVINSGVLTSEAFEKLLQQFQVEFLSSDFTGLEFYLTVWGENPGPSPER